MDSTLRIVNSLDMSITWFYDKEGLPGIQSTILSDLNNNVDDKDYEEYFTSATPRNTCHKSKNYI